MRSNANILLLLLACSSVAMAGGGSNSLTIKKYEITILNCLDRFTAFETIHKNCQPNFQDPKYLPTKAFGVEMMTDYLQWVIDPSIEYYSQLKKCPSSIIDMMLEPLY